MTIKELQYIPHKHATAINKGNVTFALVDYLPLLDVS